MYFYCDIAFVHLCVGMWLLSPTAPDNAVHVEKRAREREKYISINIKKTFFQKEEDEGFSLYRKIKQLVSFFFSSFLSLKSKTKP